MQRRSKQMNVENENEWHNTSGIDRRNITRDEFMNDSDFQKKKKK